MESGYLFHFVICYYLCPSNLCPPSYVGAKEKYNVDVGEHAIAENIVPCWECRYCLRGNYNMCKSELCSVSECELLTCKTITKCPHGNVILGLSL